MNYHSITLYTAITILLTIMVGCNNQTSEQNVLSKHVIVIGIDALSPDGIRSSNTPNIDRLMQSGAHTLKARGVMPTNSSPNWASMIMGAGPEQHGVTSNSWQPDDFDLSPTYVGPGGIFPTIFSVLKQQRPDYKLGAVYDWPGFARLFEHDFVDYMYMPSIPRETTEDRILWAEDTMDNAIIYMVDEEPEFLFIQLDHVDHIGHRLGHGSDEYYYYTSHADSLIGNMLTALEENDLINDTTIIISSDHGGIDFGHGGATDLEVFIPVIISGPQTRSDYDLGNFVNTYDTATTIAYIFGIEPHDAWIGKPLKDAFE